MSGASAAPRSRPGARRSRGVYSGAVQFYLGDRLEQIYPATVRAVTDAGFLALPAQPFAEVFRRWFPMAVHLLEGLFLGQRNRRAGRAAGAAARAGHADRRADPRAEQPGGRRRPGDRRAARPGRRHAAQAGAAGGGQARRRGAAVADRAAGGVRRPHRRARRSSPRWRLRPRGRARRLARGARGAPAVGAGRRVRRRPASGADDLERVADAVAPAYLEPALRWLAYTVETETLLAEIADAPAGSRTWSTPPSSTRRWTGRRTSRPTCTTGSTPRW